MSGDQQKEEVSFDIADLFAFLWLRKFSIAITVVVLVSFGYSYLKSLPKQYAASSTLLLSEDSSTISLSGLSALTGKNPSAMDTHIEFIRSRNFLTEIVEENKLQFEKEFLVHRGKNRGRPDVAHTVEVIREDLSLSVIVNTDMLKVNFVAKNPELAARIVNEIGPAFFRYQAQKETERAQNASTWLNQQIESIRETLTQSEVKLQDFLEANKIVDVQSEMTLLQSEIVALMRERIVTEKQLSEINASAAQMDSVGGDTFAAVQVPAVASAEYVRVLRSQYQAQLLNFEEVKKRYKHKHYRYIAAETAVKSVEEEMKSTVLQIRRALGKQSTALAERLRDIDGQIGKARDQHTELGNLEVNLTRLKREVESNQQLYDAFLGRLQEAEVLKDLGGKKNYSIIDVAQVPKAPVFPRMALSIAVITILSTFLSIIIWLIVHLLSDKHTRYKQLLKKLDIPVLAEIPNTTSRLPQRMQKRRKQRAKQAFDEAVRSIRASLLLLDNHDPTRVILFTGVSGKDENAKIAENTARSIGNIERVLLIDADINEHFLNKQFGIDKEHKGFTDLINKRASFSDTIVKPAGENITLLPVGSPSNDIAAIYSKTRTGAYLQKLRVFYERVIIAAPPVNTSSEGLVLSRNTEGAIIVCDVEKNEPSELVDAIQHIQDTGKPILGIVLMGVKILRKKGNETRARR